jgi:uncharacterized membrane protein
MEEDLLDNPEKPNTNFFVYLWNYKSWSFTLMNITSGIALFAISIVKPGHIILIIPFSTLAINWFLFYVGYEDWRADSIKKYQLGIKDEDEDVNF